MKLEALFVAVAAVGCGDVATDNMMIDESDTVAPLVVSTTPTAGVNGVASGAKIEITFSESMDPATVEEAYSSQLLPLDKVSISWNADQTVMTISPDAALLYGNGTGNDPSTATRLTYGITIGPEAADLVGNTMDTSLELSFSTKVRMVTTAVQVSDLTATKLGADATVGGASVVMGDASIQDLPYRGYATFDLGLLPEGIALESAELSAHQDGIEGSPYGLLGALKAYHLTFSLMDAVNTVAPLSTIGNFSESGDIETKSIDVTANVTDDLANAGARNYYSQYRLQFDTVAANDAYDRVIFSKSSFALSLVYVAD